MTRDDARSSDAPEGACGEARELVSADLDGELSPDEVARLVAHLSGCAACREHRDRLRRLVRALRGAGSLVAAEPGWAEGLDARLAATEAEERGAAPAAAAPDGEADVAGAGLVVRTASGRVVAQARTAWARWGRWAAAAALILGATGLLLAQVDELRAKLANRARPEVTPQYQPPSSPTPQVSTPSMWASASSARIERTSIDSEKSSGEMPAIPPSSVTPTTYVAVPSPERTRWRSCAARLSSRPSARCNSRESRSLNSTLPPSSSPRSRAVSRTARSALIPPGEGRSNKTLSVVWFPVSHERSGAFGSDA